MKKRDLVSLFNGLLMIEGRASTVKFNYFVAKNKLLLKNEFIALEETKKPSESYIEFDSKRADLARKLADKDENGQPNIQNNNFVIIEKVDEFQEQMEGLKKEYDEVIKEQEQKMKDYEVLLDEEYEYKGLKIDLKDIPDSVAASILEVFIISELIIDDSVIGKNK